MGKKFKRIHPLNPAPDDADSLPAGHMRCTVWDHDGPRILPATPIYFRRRTGKRLGIEAVCRACANRYRRTVATPKRRIAAQYGQLFRQLSGNKKLILRGPAWAQPTKIAQRYLPCSQCFNVKQLNKENYDMDTYRIEPVCHECQKQTKSPQTQSQP